MNHQDRVQEFTKFVQTGLQQGMNRREFLRRGLALGLSLPSVLAVLAACGAEQSPQAAIAPTATPEPPATALPPTATSVPPTATAAPTATVEPPTATPTPPTRFGVIGDYGLAGEPEEAVSELVKSWSPDFIITTGDNNYPDGAAATLDNNVGLYYAEFIAPYKGAHGAGSTTNRFFPVLGNHDWDLGMPQPYLDYFTLPNNGRYYSFTQGPISFFALDSALDEPDGHSADSVQGQWLQRELAAAQSRWNVVYMHHPPFSSGHHGSSPWMQLPYREWGAHVVLSGHDHNYERIVVDDLIYVINGLGGGARYAPGSEPIAGSQTFYNANHGAMLAEATAEQVSFLFMARDGEVLDTFQLS